MFLVAVLATIGIFAFPVVGQQKEPGSSTIELPDLESLQGSSLDPQEARWATWFSNIEALEKKFASYDLDNGCVLFIGSSSIVRWKTLASDFPGLPVVNNGFGGSRIVDSVYFADRLVTPLKPHTIVMFAGSNDISGKVPAAQVLADYAAFVKRVHDSFPETKIYFISIAPSPARWSQHERVMEANQLIELYSLTDERLEFIDVYTYMLGADGLPQPDLYGPDNLHMSPKGYELWTDIVRTYLGSEDGLTYINGEKTGVADISVSPFLQDRLLSGPLELDVKVSTLPVDLPVSQVEAILDGVRIFTGQTSSFKLPLNKGDLAEGVHRLQIKAVAAGQEMTRTFLFQVDNIQLSLSVGSGGARGVLPVKVETSLPLGMIQQVSIEVNGTPVWQGRQQVADIALDTRQFTDGATIITGKVTSLAGVESAESERLVIWNRWSLYDTIDPPVDFFGVLMKRERALSASSGWMYGAEEKSLFEDTGRRLRKANTTEELIWEAKTLDRAAVTIYTKDAENLKAVLLSVSADEKTWVELPFDVELQEASARGWHKYEITASVPEDQVSELFRLTVLPHEAPPDELQVGAIYLQGWL